MKSKRFFYGFMSGWFTGIVSVVVFSLVSVYTFCCPLNPQVGNRLLFLPLKDYDSCDQGREVNGIKAKDVTFKPKDSDITLTGRLYSQSGSSPLVLLSHGQGGNLSYLYRRIDYLLSTGASVFAYDYRGYGHSTGSPSVRGLVEDAHAAYDYVVGRLNYSPDQIILYGESLGTAMTTALAADVPCAGVVLDSGFVSIEKVSKEIYGFVYNNYPSWMFPKEGLDNSVFVKQANHPPILLLAGGKDTYIQCHHSQYLYDHGTQPIEIAIFDRCGHAAYDPERNEMLERLKKFFAKCTEHSDATAPKTASHQQ